MGAGLAERKPFAADALPASLNRGDTVILQLLAAVEIIETDYGTIKRQVTGKLFAKSTGALSHFFPTILLRGTNRHTEQRPYRVKAM